MCGIGTDWLKAGSEQATPDPLTPGQKGRALAIFVKNPAVGKVKTRLAKTMGDQAAFDAYLQMLSHVRSVTRQVDCHRAVFYSDFIDGADEWVEPTFSKHLQSTGDIGQRMRAAIETLLQEGYSQVALVGSDFLDLQVQHLEQAFRALGFADVVIGPAHDGGYYLIGMKAMVASLFEDIPWSTATVMEETREKAARLNLQVHLLPEISDIDEEPEWLAALQRHQKRQHRT